MAKKTQPSVTPEGYRRVPWSDVKTNNLVYLGNFEGVLSPYVVVDAESRAVRPVTGMSEDIRREDTVLVKNGPIIVVITKDKRFVGVYTDIPLEIVSFEDSATDYRVSRPKVIESIPTTQMASLHHTPPPAGWPCHYGEWELTNIRTTGQNKFSFELTNQLTSLSLAAELIRLGQWFSVLPNKADKPTFWTFTVTKGTMSVLMRNFETILGEVPHVTRDIGASAQ